VTEPRRRSAKEAEALLIQGVKDAVAIHRGEMLPSRVTMRYKGYIGMAVPDKKQKLMHGHVVNTLHDGIAFAGKTSEDLEQAFKGSVNYYLEVCRKHERKPERPVKRGNGK
jgi:hypothetical protein